MKNPPEISVVSPVYFAEKIVEELVQRIEQSLKEITDNYEIILVEDAGPDNSWEKIEDICKNNKNVKGIKLSKNFGQHKAISAGVKEARGNNIVLIDCDLQDNPSDIKLLYAKRKEGFNIIFTRRKKRKHGILKTISTLLYNKLFLLFSDKNYDFDAGSLVLFSRKVANEFNKLKDKDRLYLQMLKWLGFNSTHVEVEHHERFEGKSSYSFLKLLKLGLEGWTSHSDKLLRLSAYIGLILAFVSFCLGVIIVIRYFFFELQPGWPSIIVTILFSTGLIMSSIGVLGIYIAKIFDQSKGRPLYVIETKLNFDD